MDGVLQYQYADKKSESFAILDLSYFIFVLHYMPKLLNGTVTWRVIWWQVMGELQQSHAGAKSAKSLNDCNCQICTMIFNVQKVQMVSYAMVHMQA